MGSAGNGCNRDKIRTGLLAEPREEIRKPEIVDSFANAMEKLRVSCEEIQQQRIR